MTFTSTFGFFNDFDLQPPPPQGQILKSWARHCLLAFRSTSTLYCQVNTDYIRQAQVLNIDNLRRIISYEILMKTPNNSTKISIKKHKTCLVHLQMQVQLGHLSR